MSCTHILKACLTAKKARVSPGDTGGKDIADGTGMMLPHYMTTAKDRKNSRKVMY